jgi:hypothetical protein
MNKENIYIYTVEFYSAINKNEIVSFAGKWMELEIIMLNPTKTSVIFSLICGS